MLDTATYLPKLAEFEGRFSYMYLDTVGKVTVGVGKMLPDAAAAQRLGFVRRADGTPATPDEIQAEYGVVKSQAIGRLAAFYKQFTKLDLPDQQIDGLLSADVARFKANLSQSFPDFDSYPDAACAALFDMGYNLGVTKLTTEFPHFCRAVRSKDWATAAQECHRNGINDARNGWTKAQFQMAAAG